LLTIWQAHRAALLAGIVLAALSGFLAWARLHARVERAPPFALRLVAFVPLLLALAVGARGSTGHRPLNISFAASSTDPLVNDLALNSTYSALHALLQMRRERDVIKAYGRLPGDEVIGRIRAGMQLPPAAFDDPSSPSLHMLVPTGHPQRRPNLVILLQESLGAHYFHSLGGLPVARKLEAWQTRSFWFDQLYASGTRSARGLEAVVSGFPPTRARSVLKLEGAQRDFFTLARALKGLGYRTEFIYGGDSSFDNMRRFFLGNGFDRVIDWTDLLPEARFSTTWGVSDEDLYARVHREVSAHEHEGQPFFTLVFSTSNHPPYDFPDGRIELYEQPKMTANNAARYADFAVGSYLETAARSPYWADTLFMVVADHESKAYGAGLVPIFSFHIPGFIAGGPVEPRIVSRIASQTDLVPTALSLMGLTVRIPATGIDQSRTDLAGPGMAMMQLYDDAAYRVGNDVEILVPEQPPRHFIVRGETLAAAPPDTELERDALAHAQWPVMAYESGWYR
jgi:phosphoglycerol transferase MdoB-like AlkP superfamily enzyme